jgi:hypothetical protein
MTTNGAITEKEKNIIIMAILKAVISDDFTKTASCLAQTIRKKIDKNCLGLGPEILESRVKKIFNSIHGEAAKEFYSNAEK